MKRLNNLFIFAFLTISFLTVKAQTTVIIEPDNYKTKANPYMIPTVTSGSDFYLVIKTGAAVYISVTGTDKGTGNYYKATSPTRTENGDTIQIVPGDPGNWLVNYNSNATAKTIKLHIDYQVDIFDRTTGSLTYGKRPDFIWGNAGESATVSAGPYFNNTGGTRGYYRWRNLAESILSAGYTDSLHIFSTGTYISQATDFGGIITRDTISILDKPTFNNSAKTLNFPTTTTGINYKLLKVGSITGNDTTWTETQNFVGDGNAKNITLTDGKYKLTTTRGIHTAVYPFGYFIVGITTVLDKTKEETINYRLVDNKLQFDNEVNFKLYSLQGQLLQQGQGSSFKLCRQVGIFKATDKNGNVLTAKIILK
jgi:hypothetical protein